MWNKSIYKFVLYSAKHQNLHLDAPIALRKVHYNVMRFKETLAVDEAEVLAGRFRSVSRRHYVLHDPQKQTDKYVTAW